MAEEIIALINGIPIRRNFIHNLPYNPSLLPRAKKLRKAGVYSEVVFWQQVHKDKFYGIDFDRQRIIGNYIADFYVKSLSLVVEIDGESHNDKDVYDERREAYFVSLGIKVYRITSLRVLHDLNNVMIELERYIIDNYGIIEPPRPKGTPPREGNSNTQT